MFFAQTLLLIALMTGLSVAALQGGGQNLKETMLTLGASRLQRILDLIREARFSLVAAFSTGFPRVLGETGMTMMVGGNIRGQTRVMTTAIALGSVLLLVAIVVNIALQLVQGRAGR